MTLDKNKYDELLYIYSVLKRLGCGDVNTFDERLMTQKVQYFAQLFGVTHRYDYNLYINGPYSPFLSNDLYKIKELKLKPMLEKFIPNDLEKRFSDLKKFIFGVNNRKLEIISTAHWLSKVACLKSDEVYKKMIELKNISKDEYNYLINKIKEYDEIKKNYN
jgi:uncharacterized protein YwgA